jgi:pimeloyl-ACP methyl ester carboxylesterase
LSVDEKAQKVLVIGVSMGAAAAAQLAAVQPKHVAGLLVGEPWSNLWYETVVVRTPISYVLAAWVWLISPKFDTVAAVSSLPPDRPFAVLSPQADQLIEPREHRWVFEASGASKKWWLPAANTGHSNVGKQARLNAR